MARGVTVRRPVIDRRARLMAALAMALALLFGVLSGVYPAWRMSRLNPVDALKGGVSR